MATPTINHDAAVAEFRRLIARDSAYRLLYLTGDTKMGKSHLLRRVFVELAEQSNIPCAILDLRSQTQDTRDLLSLLDQALRVHFDLGAYQEAARSATFPRLDMRNIVAYKSKLDIDATTNANLWEVARQLTMQLALDVGRAERPMLLLVDAADQAPPPTVDWLAQTLLGEFCLLPHVRTVVAGRTAPTATTTYAAQCVEHRLEAVDDPQAYIKYCEDAGIACPPEGVDAVVKVAKYTPGVFAELVAGVDWGT